MYRKLVENNVYESWTGKEKHRFTKNLQNTNGRYEDDEISRSLKMFAMLTAYTTEPQYYSENQIDAIRQEFACNGYSRDDIRYQQQFNCLPTYPEIHVRDGVWKMFPYPAEQTRKPHHTRKYNQGSKGEKHAPMKHCVFCENNNEPEAVVKSHAVRDSLGRVLCPKLRTYVCPICKASGDLAHTVKYCPQKPIITMEDAIKAESFRLSRSSFFRQQMKI